jgi:small-conductance mechanosensitive channel
MVMLQYYPEAITNIVAGLLIIAFGILMGNILGVLSKKLFEAFEVEHILHSWNIGFPIEEFVSSLIKYITYLIGLIWGLTFLGLETIILYVILLIILGLLIAFILLALKDFIPNFVAGIIINLTKKVNKREYIKLDNAEGKVIKVHMLETKIKTPDGDIVLIPNVLINKRVVTKNK